MTRETFMPWLGERRIPRRCPRSLVAFYSMSGHTRTLANEIRDLTCGHIEEIHEPRTRHGIYGETLALLDSLARRAPPILPAERDPALYELLLLGGPVWAGRIAAPLRSFARLYGARARRVAFFVTYDADGADSAFEELASLCDRRPEAVLAVPAHALVSGAHTQELRRFVDAVLRSTAPAADFQEMPRDAA